MKLSKIRNRKELFNLFNSVITNTYDSLVEKGELDSDQNLLKTYIIETNVNFKKFIKQEYYNIKISFSNTEDDNLKYLIISQKSKLAKEEKKAEFFLDTIDDRFWQLYSLDKSEIATNIVEKLLSSNFNHLDHPWFESDILEKIIGNKFDEIRGMEVKYNYNDVFKDINTDYDNLYLKITGSSSKAFIDTLKKNDKIGKTLSFDSITGKKYNENEKIVDSVNYWGKILTKGGDNIDVHLDILEKIINLYKEKIKEIESYRLDNIFNHKENSKGRPLIINFPKPINNLRYFLDKIFSAKQPFKLWGIINEVEKKYFIVNAVDLHNRDEINLEITENWIRCYLPYGACGNTIERLVCNLQRYLNAKIKLNLE